MTPYSSFRRRCAFFLSLALAVAPVHVLPDNTIHAQDCSSCKPQRRNNYMAGTYEVCMEMGRFTHGQKTAIEDGAKYWRDYLAAQGVHITLNFNERDLSDPSCQISVSAASTPGADAQTWTTPNGIGTRIEINENNLGRTSQNYWNELLGHEWGHAFGFENVTTSGCGQFTIMHESEWHGSLPANPLCSDAHALGEAYSSSGGSDDDTYYEPLEDECYDVYLVRTVYYVWTDGRITQGPTYTFFLGTECYPLD